KSRFQTARSLKYWVSRASSWRVAPSRSIARPCISPPLACVNRFDPQRERRSRATAVDSARRARMNLNITGHNIEITPALRSYTQNKLERVLRRTDQVIDASVVLRLEKVRHVAEIVVRVPSKDICVSGDEEDMYAAID